MRLDFKTKARNLKNLKGRLKTAEILPLCIIQVRELNKDKQAVLDKLQALPGKSLIIRSSSSSEDSIADSKAGAFLSLAAPKQEGALLESLEKVAAALPSLEDEILIQPLLEDIEICGVGFSVDKDNAAPYFCLSYDRSGSNEAVTSGTTSVENYYYFRGAKASSFGVAPPEPLGEVIALMLELEEIFDSQRLDIEFAFGKGPFDSKARLYCLQVRPLVMENKPNLFGNLSTRALERLAKRINSLASHQPYILGERALFGVMPDWNPAEIIGLKPKRLALSLYKELVTDSVWAYQRDNYGYRNLRSYPLMHSFLGAPFIDVRVCFNSFIPKNLDLAIANKLANYYLESLCKAPNLHDKVEFEIVLSCYDFNISAKLERLLNHGFNANEIKRIEYSLLELTNNIINPKQGYYLKDLEKTKALEDRYKSVVDSSLPLYDKIYWLVEHCKRFGTLPFAGVARAAFIALTLLNSLVDIGFLSREERAAFLGSLNTVSRQLSLDTQGLDSKSLGDFLEKYGHLRAGSYNLLSPRYDEDFQGYFGDLRGITESKSAFASFHLSHKRLERLDSLLRENGLLIGASELFDFFRLVIEGREKVKFEFSKLLSMILKLIETLGGELDIAKEDLAHLDIQSLLSLYSSLYRESPRERLLSEIESNKQEYKLTLALKLPPLILRGEEVFGFYSAAVTPNFITTKAVIAPVATLDSGARYGLEGCIVCVPQADPGFDFLFTKNIAGLVTCYGGANSHMAVRASELGLPSAIGVGEELFSKVCASKRIRLDCESNQIFCL